MSRKSASFFSAPRIVLFGLLSFGLVTVGLFLGLLGDDPPKSPTESPTVKVASSSAVHIRGLDSKEAYDLEMTRLNEVLSCDLGTVWTHSQVDLNFRVRNQTKKTFVAADVKSSCSCLGSIRNDLSIPVGRIGDVFAQFHVSNQEGQFERTVTLVEAESGFVTILIKGSVLNPISLSSGSIVATKEDRESGRCTYQLEVTKNKHFPFDWNEIEWRTEFATPCQIEVTETDASEREVSSQKRKIAISFDVKKLPTNSVSSELRVLGFTKRGLTFTTECRVFYAFNSSTTPRRLTLKQGKDSWNGSLIVHNPNFFREAGTSQELELSLRKVNGSAESKSIPVKAIGKHLGDGSYQLHLTAELDSLQTGDVFQAFELRRDQFEWFRVPVVLER